MAYNEKVFSRQYSTVVYFVQHLAYFRAINTGSGGVPNHHKNFWVSTSNSHLKLAAVDWCKVFGSYNEDMHWTKIPAGEILTQMQEDFLQRVLFKTGFSLEGWKTYQKNMLEFRNKFVAHVDLSEPFRGHIPSFDPALQVAYAYEQWIRDVVAPIHMSRPTLSTEFELWMDEVYSILSQYSLTRSP